MLDAQRVHDVPDAEAMHRDGQIEALLMDGLDRYFNGRYEEAIHLWTRVLFLDRTHARARAYIDRARSAMAERQRRSEEMLQTSRQMLDRGETVSARSLLAEAAAVAGEDDRVAALRARLDRTERLHGVIPGTLVPLPAARQPIPGWSWTGRTRRLAGLAAATAIGIALVAVIALPVLQDLMDASSAERLTAASVAPPLPILSSADVALVRARTLYDRGRLAEALVALDRVSAESPQRAAADRLRVEIQQLLLDSSRRASGRSPGTGVVPR